MLRLEVARLEREHAWIKSIWRVLPYDGWISEDMAGSSMTWLAQNNSMLTILLIIFKQKLIDIQTSMLHTFANLTIIMVPIEFIVLLVFIDVVVREMVIVGKMVVGSLIFV